MSNVIKSLKFILFSAILITAATSTNAQTDEAKNLPNFLLPEFTQAVVKFKSGQSRSAVLNYNLVDQEMVFRQDNNYMVLDTQQSVDTIFVSNRSFVQFDKYFYELVLAGPVSFYIQHKANVEALGTPTGYGATTQTTTAGYQRQVYGHAGTVNLKIPDEFKIVGATDYWVKKDGQMEKVTTKRMFLKVFKDKEKELSKFIDANSTSFKNISDMVKLLNYTNELYAK
jgi:hypothetical protein